ncbi:hypothetical protein GE115_13915 [Agromyces sp. CFH 90414]|uniref:Integral membrane regulator n=1 Tax=Agromyces agglutinans TaxID=2662258 RepID=A0A6I2FGB8_9MICO|nr:Pr6Pr family membrane protein [Agromyces agglutinans]MRG60953.1 hypothetical protein [Agromyces agglutinans]
MSAAPTAAGSVDAPSAIDAAPAAGSIAPIAADDEVGRAAFTWRLVMVLALVAGLVSDAHPLHFFTTQVSVIALGYFAVSLHLMVVRRTGAAPAPRLRGAIVLWLVATMLVSHVVDRGGENPIPGLLDASTPAELLANRSVFLLLYAVPVLALVDFVVFRPHGATRLRDLPLWLAFPAGYVVMAVGRALLLPEAPDRFPYGFLDPGDAGFVGVGLRALALGVGVAVIGAVLVAVDRMLRRLD